MAVKEPTFTSAVCSIIGYLLTKHLIIGSLLTKRTCAWCGPWRVEDPREPHSAGPLAHKPHEGGGGDAPSPWWHPWWPFAQLNVFITPNPFAAFTKRCERATKKIISSHSLHLRLPPHIDSLSYLTKTLSFKSRKLLPLCVLQHKVADTA